MHKLPFTGVVTSSKISDQGILVGSTILGKYRVESVLGEGGMGVVVKARHLGLNEEVAIKSLRANMSLDTEAISRFVREAQAAVKLKSEHVARVSDVGTFDDGRPYMVMEYLDGQDLEVFATQNGKINPQLAIELILQAAEALAEAHSLGIVHRDIKPTNLFITWRPDGSPLLKVLDFGISKSPLGADLSLTQTQSILGTPAYMSPEQMRSARMVDPRTDIWSLGTVLYEVLEGQRPFEAESFSEMCVKVAMDAPTPMRNVPSNLAEVIFRCLAKTPEQRYPNIAEFARAIAPFCRDPQQAMRSVERMIRMLGRRAHSWDADTNGHGIPRPVADVESRGSASDFAVDRTPPPVQGGHSWPNAEHSNPAWTGGQPVVAAGNPATWTGATPVVASPRQSEPVLAPLQTFAAPPTSAGSTLNHSSVDKNEELVMPARSKAPLLVGLLVAVAAAVGIYLATRPQRSGQPPVTSVPAAQLQTVDANNSVGSPTGETPATMTGSGNLNSIDSAGTGIGSNAGSNALGTDVNGKAVGEIKNPELPKDTTASKPDKVTGKTGKTNGKTSKMPQVVKVIVKPEIKPEVKPEVKPIKKCDAFSTADGCKSAPK